MYAPKAAQFDEMTEQESKFDNDMQALIAAMISATTPEQKNNILDSQAKTIIEAKKKGLTKFSLSQPQVQDEISAFNTAFSKAPTVEAQETIIQREMANMFSPEVIATFAKTPEQTKFE